jgi:HK97 gp10 family phage protein
MVDGVQMKNRELDKHIAELRQLVPYLYEEMDKANEKTCKEFVELSEALAPRADGDLAESLEYGKVEGGVATFTNRGGIKRSISATSSWAVYGLWRWFFTEYGTVSTSAQPFITPVRRLQERKQERRMRAALNRAVRRVFKK